MSKCAYVTSRGENFVSAKDLICELQNTLLEKPNLSPDTKSAIQAVIDMLKKFRDAS